jgi:hypothetical protein
VTGTLRRWPLFLIASPAAVAVWSGWVGLGTMCGFGVIHPLPGIWDGLQVNTAITLPVGVEAYGAYALGAWLTPGAPEAARRFARRSAIGALALGMAGQVIYHLLAAANAAHAPWPVVVLVSSLPVVTLGFGTALAHLLRRSQEAATSADETVPKAVPEQVRDTRQPRTRAARALPAKASSGRTPNRAPEVVFAQELAAGKVPGIRPIKSRCGVGQPRAKAIKAELEAFLQRPVSEAPATIEA